MISFDEFSKIELRAVKIISAERVEGSEKLIKLRVDDGEGDRIIVAGIGKNYVPEELIHKTILTVSNLEPRTLMGIESQGMVLAMEDEPILVTFDREVKPGSIAH